MTLTARGHEVEGNQSDPFANCKKSKRKEKQLVCCSSQKNWIPGSEIYIIYMMH